MKNFLYILLLITALGIGACVEVGTDPVAPEQLQPIEVKDINITITEGDTVFLNLHDSITANWNLYFYGLGYGIKVLGNCHWRPK